MPHSEPHIHWPGRLARRDFLSVSAGTVTVGATASAVRAGVEGPIRIGLIGCGGRGTGAAIQAAAADPGVRIVAIGDAFPEPIASAAHVLARDAAPQFDCPVTRRFSGTAAFQRVLDLDVDAVLIAAPPHLRPLHVEAAISAGKHVFCETPAAVDVPGALRVAHALAGGRRAGLSVASGLHGRRDDCLIDAVDRLRAGAIGRPRAVVVHAAAGVPWRVPAQPGWTAAEERLRNWISWPALSGGVFVERHVHAIDRALWVLGDRAPVVAEPLAGSGPDAVAVRYRFDDGAEILASARRDGEGVCSETVLGSRGSCELRLAADGRRFQATMDGFLRAIRSARAMDDAGVLVRGTLVTLMGRLAATTGRPVAWTDVLSAASPAFPVGQIGTDVNLPGV